MDAVLGTVAGLKRFVSIADSPYHGLNFCQGTIAQMLADPGRELFEVIRYFGTRKKIFNVHFRNIRGRRDDFEERFPDEGDIDFAQAIRVYKQVGYDGMLMPDHVPRSPDDPDQRQAYAFLLRLHPGAHPGGVDAFTLSRRFPPGRARDTEHSPVAGGSYGNRLHSLASAAEAL